MGVASSFPLLAAVGGPGASAAGDLLVKALAALAVILAPLCLFLFTQRTRRVESVKLERTEVEKLYIDGTARLMASQRDEAKSKAEKAARLEAERDALRAELASAHRSMHAFTERYQAALSLLERAGVAIPSEVRMDPLTGDDQPTLP